MALRTLLFLSTNLVVVLTISLILGALASLGLLPANLPWLPLLVGCFAWGMLGSWLSLQFSARSAMAAMGVRLANDDPSAAARGLVNLVAALADRASLPIPAVGVYNSPEWNAFATGPSPQRALVAVSSGILEGMPAAELEAVLAHELSHISNGDMVTMSLLQGVVNAFVMVLARVVALLVPNGSRNDDRQPSPPLAGLVWPLELLFGMGGSLITAWFSRHREFRADAGAAGLTSPEAMASALERLGQASGIRDPRDSNAMARFKIASADGWISLFASHPPLEQRIAALRQSGVSLLAG
ncbi:MAG: protease HtpX [Cyanobacteriota bacterium]|nr:protease HtpX [Cyanobacteriota bacterium]